MDNRETKPAVEPGPIYEDPPPREQKQWNFGITGMVALVAIIFGIVIIAAIVIFS